MVLCHALQDVWILRRLKRVNVAGQDDLVGTDGKRSTVNLRV